MSEAKEIQTKKISYFYSPKAMSTYMFISSLSDDSNFSYVALSLKQSFQMSLNKINLLNWQLLFKHL